MEITSKYYFEDLKKRDALKLESDGYYEAASRLKIEYLRAMRGSDHEKFRKLVDDAISMGKRYLSADTEIQIKELCLSIRKRKIHRAAMDLLEADPSLSNYLAAQRERATLSMAHQAGNDEIRKLEELISGQIDVKAALVKEIATSCDDGYKLEESLIKQFDSASGELYHLSAALHSKKLALNLLGGRNC